jgi:hypothetical protein
MKTYPILFFVLATILFSCDDDDNHVVDPIHEFVAFRGTPVISVNENENSAVAYPVVVQLYAFEPYTEDIDLTLDITPNNTAENVDFIVTPSQSVKIKAGRLVSDTIFIKTIDNALGSNGERSFDIRIDAVNKDINIGLGLAEPKNASLKVVILDDECSGSPLCIFSTISENRIDGTTVKPVESVLDKDNSEITVTGDLINYATFPAATLTLTFTPESEGASTGSATFGEQETGTDNDGYKYKFVEAGTGTYDADAGTIHIEYDIYYLDGEAWVWWYKVTNDFSGS